MPHPRPLGAAHWWLSIALTLAAGPAHTTPVITAANIPNSAFAPGGVNMASGELILVMRPDLVLPGPMPLMFERLYGSIFEGILGERITTRPVEVISPFPWHGRRAAVNN